jgi:hypothetical protein
VTRVARLRLTGEAAVGGTFTPTSAATIKAEISLPP